MLARVIARISAGVTKKGDLIAIIPSRTNINTVRQVKHQLKAEPAKRDYNVNQIIRIISKGTYEYAGSSCLVVCKASREGRKPELYWLRKDQVTKDKETL